MALPYAAHLDIELITRIRAGDEDAFAQLVERHYRSLCLYAARIVGSMDAAEEIVQEVLFRIWIHRERLRATETLASYLFTSVRNYALNQRTRAGREQRWLRTKWFETQDTPPQAPDADQAVQEAEIAVVIERAIMQLPPRCRQAFILRRQQQLSYVEIAHIMQITPKTVEVQIGNALKLLRKSLAEWMPYLR